MGAMGQQIGDRIDFGIQSVSSVGHDRRSAPRIGRSLSQVLRGLASPGILSTSGEKPSPLVRGPANQQWADLRSPKRQPQAAGHPPARAMPNGEHVDGLRAKPRPTAALQFCANVQSKRILDARAMMMARHVIGRHALPYSRRREQGVGISIDGRRNEPQATCTTRTQDIHTFERACHQPMWRLDIAPAHAAPLHLARCDIEQAPARQVGDDRHVAVPSIAGRAAIRPMAADVLLRNHDPAAQPRLHPRHHRGVGRPGATNPWFGVIRQPARYGERHHAPNLLIVRMHEAEPHEPAIAQQKRAGHGLRET